MIQIAPTRLPKMGSGRVSLQRRKEYESEMAFFRAWMQQTVESLGFSPGSRSWCYLFEDAHIITKGDFTKATKWLADARKSFDSDGKPLIPRRFVAKDDARQMTGADVYDKEKTARDYINSEIRDMQARARQWWPASFWKYQHSYPILWTEKADLVKLFEPAMHPAIKRFTGKGWADINSRANVVQEVVWARDNNLEPVILYCGDHDPAGVQISDMIRSNLRPIAEVLLAEQDIPMSYEFSRALYSMEGLEIVRFGLNTDFIEDNDLLWIDGLETSSGRDLNDPGHPDHNKPHVQQYLAEHGPRKVEANALITRPEAAQQLITDVLDQYIDADGVERWEAENREASKEATEKVEHLIKMLTFLDTQGWLYSGHKLEAAAEIHRAKTLPSGPEIDV